MTNLDPLQHQDLLGMVARLLSRVIWLAVLLTPDRNVRAEEPSEEKSAKRQMIDGLLSSFSLPLKDLLDWNHSSETRHGLDGLSGSFGFSYPMRGGGTGVRHFTEKKDQDSSPAFSTGIKYNPITSWFAGATFYRYLGKRHDWDPDFSYTFGYDDWHPYTLSLVYSNYNGNRLAPSKGESAFDFEQGTWTLAWKFPAPRILASALGIGGDDQILCQSGLNIATSYEDDRSDEIRNWKDYFGLGCNLPIYKGLSLDWAIYYYPQPKEQQPSDADYTYSLTYSPPSLANVSFSYSNYSSNRYPWRGTKGNNGHLEDGAISVSWSWRW